MAVIPRSVRYGLYGALFLFGFFTFVLGAAVTGRSSDVCEPDFFFFFVAKIRCAEK
jgi:hypothetical protein